MTGDFVSLSNLSSLDSEIIVSHITDEGSTQQILLFFLIFIWVQEKRSYFLLSL